MTRESGGLDGGRSRTCRSRAIRRWFRGGTDIYYDILNCGHRHYPRSSPHVPDEHGMVRCFACEAGSPGFGRVSTQTTVSRSGWSDFLY